MRCIRLDSLSGIILTSLLAFSVGAEVPHPLRLGGPLVDGSVVRTRGCGAHFFIAFRNEFALAEWLGGDIVKDGDVLQVNDDQLSFEREGRMTLTNLATGRAIDVVLEKVLMNHADYSRAAGQVCHT
jgi:hypothetical protein